MKLKPWVQAVIAGVGLVSFAWLVVYGMALTVNL